jgi:hypothetical protein
VPRTIFKYDTQGGVLRLWAEVNPDEEPTQSYLIAVVGTGQLAPDHRAWGYVGTAVTNPYVWHVYVQERVV